MKPWHHNETTTPWWNHNTMMKPQHNNETMTPWHHDETTIPWWNHSMMNYTMMKADESQWNHVVSSWWNHVVSSWWNPIISLKKQRCFITMKWHGFIDFYCDKTMWFHHDKTTWFHRWNHIRSWIMKKLWKPVTSLIMVRFSIQKKFWKALDLFYHFLSFPVVSRRFQRAEWRGFYPGNDRNDMETTETMWKRQETTESDRGDQELSKTFCGLKIGPLLRKLQAFKV